ncbi:2-keto-4-pentenoate hydratase [Ilumatobacter nonamiensis]|uniref:2-keto-4-pentenoate hydratase n=1 Tax=Ilumatobacter nonamiensis TaxID=467093 RepID=UPI00034D23C0|nr:fumarylacetoacetate hydrolase family protein [Ilumatobacter nonamiensis]
MSQPPLQDDQIAAVAAELDRAEVDGEAIDALTHEPVDVADGYRIQAATHGVHGDDLVAWKAGCTNDAAQQMLHIDAPVFGRYRRDHVEQSPASLTITQFPNPPHLEVEIGLRLMADVDEIPPDPLELADVVEAFAAIEVVSGRLAGFPFIGAPQLVADNVASGRMIVGPTLELPPAGTSALDSTAVELVVDGDVVASGSGAAVLGHPLRVLRDVAVHAAVTGRGLRTGHLVLTGSCTGIVAARPGRLHVGRVGGAEVVVRFD